MIHRVQNGPDAALIRSTEEDEEPECGEHEAEDGHEHDPAQRIVRKDSSGGHQDPDQTSKHKFRDEEDVRDGREDPAARRQNVP